MVEKPLLKNQILELLNKISLEVTSPLTIYMIGGGALCLKNLKNATNDLDFVCLTMHDFNLIKSALEKIGYKQAEDLLGLKVYETATAVFESTNHNKIDVFVKDICQSLRFSSGMQMRGEIFSHQNNLKTKLVSNEDIFLFKSITEREKDIIDCINLLNVGVNEAIIIRECIEQEKRALWRFWLYEQLCRIEEFNSNIKIPFKMKIGKLCKEKWNKKPKDFMHDIQNKEKHRIR